MSKTFVVMRREFLSTVKRKSYLIVTFGMPFFLTIYLGLFALVPYIAKERSDRAQKPVAIVDLAGIVRLEEATAGADTDEVAEKIGSLTRGLGAKGASGRMVESILKNVTASPNFLSYETTDEALAALQAGELDRVYVIPEDYLEPARDYTQHGQTDDRSHGRSSFLLGSLRHWPWNRGDALEAMHVTGQHQLDRRWQRAV